eukprot:s200_g48.t1
MDTHLVYIPDDAEKTFHEFKEVTAGIGGIGIAARFLGLTCKGMMDINAMVCNTLRANFADEIIQGDVLVAHDRWKLHTCDGGSRGLLFSGYPCQPLSRQGDQAGSLDRRAAVFYGVTKSAWEMQTSGILLECVPAALTADYIQAELRRLGHSLGMEIQQRVLHLHGFWPSRRSRWWALIVPREYQLVDMGNLPQEQPTPELQHILHRWPIWNEAEERELTLTEEELQVFQNKMYGSDVRHLRINEPVPCILHSYASVLQECPCGCRAKFSILRLQRDGVRGFYVLGRDGQPRFLHVQEAAFICTFPPTLTFPSGPRKSLCLIGQCAAPLQALWVLGQFFEGMQVNPFGTARHALQVYREYLFRTAHGCFQFDLKPFPVQLWQPGEQVPLSVMVTPGETVASWLKAETKHLPFGWSTSLADGHGLMPNDFKLQMGPLVGQYMMTQQRKRQKRSHPEAIVNIKFLHQLDEDFKMVEGYFPAGVFLFEAAYALSLPRLHHRVMTETGQLIDMDARIWSNIMVMSMQEVVANGAELLVPVGGLSDLCLDVMGTKLIQYAGKTSTCFWMPATLATMWFLYPQHVKWLDHWSQALQHGRLFLAVAVERHWILLECQFHLGLLHVQYLDGQEHSHDHLVMHFIKHICTCLQITTFCLTRAQIFAQQGCQTCGTTLLLHLGARLGLWKDGEQPDEVTWHLQLFQFLPHGSLVACGKGSQADDRDLVWELRDILGLHGVPPDRTEERAKAAIEKIGQSRLREALQSKNPWNALKSLGSQPRVNFLFVKADELEVQIRRRAASRFKVQSSEKKVRPQRQRLEGSDVDPAQLQIIEGTFELHGAEGSVKQLSMQEVAAHRAGLAFGRVADVLPFLREEKSISLDGLAVLTTSRVPAAEQGLLPVINLRFPALFTPTQEPILLDGSLVNLGDMTIIKKSQQEVIETSAVDTGVIKLTQYRDEMEEDWQIFIKAPLRNILQRHPLFTLCNGQKCGGSCPKYHAPVDSDLDSVIFDVFARSWISARGKRVQAEDADAFQVLLRVPDTLLRPLQRLSGQNGLYVEPRQAEGKGTDGNTMIVWIQNGTLKDALHKLRTTEHAISVARFGQRYGVRVPNREAESIHTQINPEVPFTGFEVSKTFKLRPLPHGTQKLGVLNMLKAWGWKARPLQPCKADALGMGWLVGAAADPPGLVMPTNMGDVVVSLHRAHGESEVNVSLTSSAKTQGHLRKQQREEGKGSGRATAAKASSSTAVSSKQGDGDPWTVRDPWGGWKPSRVAGVAEDEPMHPKPMMDTLEERITHSITQSTEERFQKIEVDIAEIRNQHQKHEQWFNEAGQATQRLQSQVGTLTSQVTQHQQEVAALSTEIRSGFQSMEALLAKKQRTED